MARDYTFLRQEAEALVDLLEKNPDFIIHDHTAKDMAAELREMFGMCSYEEEQQRMNESINDQKPKTEILLNVAVYEYDPTKLSSAWVRRIL